MLTKYFAFLKYNVNSMLRIKTKYLYVLVCFIALNKLFTQEVVTDIALSKKLDETSSSWK